MEEKSEPSKVRNFKRNRYFESTEEEPELDGPHSSEWQGKRLKSNDYSYSPQKPYQNNASYYNKNQSYGKEKISEEDKKLNDLVKYYEEILQTLKTIPKEDTEMFVMNALQESKGYEVKISSSRLSSHCIEVLLLTCTDPDVLMQYMTAFSAEKIEVCTNAKASHVTELLLSIAIQNIKNWETIMESEEDTNEKKNVLFFISWVMEFGEFVVENFESCLQDHYASHVVCIIIQALAGDMSKAFSSKKSVSHKRDFYQQHVEEDSGINPQSTSVVLDNVPKFFTKMLKKLAKSLLKIDAIADYVTESSSAIVIETLTCALKKRIPKRCRKLVHRLSDKIFSERNDTGVPLAFLHRNISFVVESLFRAADEEMQCSFWSEYCVDCLESLIKHPVGNYIVQRLFDVVESQSLFEAMSDTIGNLFETILSSRHYGIFLSIAGACNRLKVQQSKFMKNMMQCLQCAEPEDRQTRLIPLILGFSVYNQSRDFICLQGSLLAQAILKFQKPIKAVNSMLSMKPQELSNLACHTQGCHVLNTFFSSPNVGEKNKDKLIQCMKPCLTNLACIRGGGLTLCRLWMLLTIKQKSIIAQQFVQDERTLQKDKNGNAILKKFGIFHFKKNNSKWKEIQNDLTHMNKQEDTSCK